MGGVCRMEEIFAESTPNPSPCRHGIESNVRSVLEVRMLDDSVHASNSKPYSYSRTRFQPNFIHEFSGIAMDPTPNHDPKYHK